MTKHIAPKLLRALCGMVVMLVLVASITSVPALAASNGIYIATATPHYKHPTTGNIEDSGGASNAVLGQSMTESATHNKALVEVDANGNTYVTVRLKLMDNIQNPQFQVDGSSVSASVMQEDYGSNTCDYRMKVNSENSIIRCNMYVVAMGREVIFYITVSNLQEGSGDFVTSIKVEKPTVTEPPATTEPETSTPETEKPTETTGPEETTKPTETTTPETSEPETSTPETSTPDTSAPDETEKPSESTGAAGLQEFDENGNKVENDETNNADEAKQDITAVLWILGGIAVAGGIGFAVWYFCFFKKK